MSRLKQEKLAEMTAVQLKELLQRQGLSTSGTKQMMIDRLLMANPAGPGVMVVETVSASRRKKPAPMPEEDEITPEATPQLSQNAVEAAATNPEPVAEEAAPAESDAAALITQLQELVAQAQAAATAAQKAQKKAEAAAASVKQKKEKKGDKKKKDKKKDRVLQEG